MEANVELHDWIEQAAVDVQRQVDEEFARVGTPEPGSALDQLGLRDGLALIRDSLTRNEAGVAFDHLLYMVTELDLIVSPATYRNITDAGRAMKRDPAEWANVTTARG